MAKLGSSNVYGDLSVSRELRTKEATIDDKAARKSHDTSGETTVSTSSPSGGDDGDLWLEV